MKLRLPADLAAAYDAACEVWRTDGSTRRLFERDATLWSGGPEANWLGWLDAPRRELAALETYREVARDGTAFRHVLVLGMGGSSLAPEVQRAVLGSRPGHPEIVVLDSIHPDQVGACEASLDLSESLIVVASKSGSTLEPNLLLAYFTGRLEAAVGAHEAARRIVAITDPGSSLERVARERGFRRVVTGEPTIGGRFSALSPFGLVPAALQGVELEHWLEGAATMAERCRDEDPKANPGVSLGLLLGATAAEGRDKLTLHLHEKLAPLGAWLEQLVAESTGKRGKAILPFDGEPLAEPELYGDDRLFVAVRFAGELDAHDGARLDALAKAGHPVVEIDVGAPEELGAEWYRWEIATAVAGARLGVDPFDQPDVEAAKVAARRLAAEIERNGSLPAETPFFEDDDLALFVPEAQARILRAGSGESPKEADVLHAHLARLVPGDYFALLAFCPMSETAREAAQRARTGVMTGNRVATSVGFGPRYLHSTGQAHKGGPESGLFVVVQDVPKEDRAVPGQSLSLGQAIAAQARGDYEVLAERGRRVVRVELKGPADDLLPKLAERLELAAGD